MISFRVKNLQTAKIQEIQSSRWWILCPKTQEILFKSCRWFWSSIGQEEICSSKTSTPLDKKEVFEFEKKKPEDSKDDTDVQVVSDEKADENNLSKAEKKKKLVEKTKSFKNFLEKNV